MIASGLSAAPGSKLIITILGTTPDTLYNQLTASGPISLADMTLGFDGTYTPVAGDTFTIVRNGASATTGTFTGLPEGALITNFLGSPLSARISYQVGADNDVFVVVTSSTTSTPTERVLPTRSGLGVARPNPVVASTNLSFALAARGSVDLAVYSVDGRRVRTLASGSYEPGEYQLTWDGAAEDGTRAGAGVYFVRLATPHGTFLRSLVLLK